MNMALPRTLILLIISTFWAIDILNAQDSTHTKVKFDISPYIWFTSIGSAESLGSDFGENVAGDYALDVHNGELYTGWMVRADVSSMKYFGYLKFSSTHFSNSTIAQRYNNLDLEVSVDYDLSWYTTDFIAGMKVGNPNRRNGLDIYGGFRYSNQSETITESNTSTSTEISASWLDPVLGARINLYPGETTLVRIYTDYGGYSIGSEFTMSMGADLTFRISDNVKFNFGYSYQEFQYNREGDSNRRYIWENGVQQGWLFGTTITLIK